MGAESAGPGDCPLHSPQAGTTVPSQAVTKLSPMDAAQALPWLEGVCLNRESFLFPFRFK